MMHTLVLPFRRAKHIFQTEGLIPLLRRGVSYLVSPFEYKTFYLFERATAIEINEADVRPKIQNFVFKVVCTNQQADELAADGLEFRSSNIDRDRLDRGAIAFCVFVERELAHITWVAMTEEARKSVDSWPYKVDFANNEVCGGAAWTNPKYRGMGLMTYVIFKEHQFVKERGIETFRFSVLTNNIAPQVGAAKFNPTIYAKARYIRILGWKIWREKPTDTAIGRS